MSSVSSAFIPAVGSSSRSTSGIERQGPGELHALLQAVGQGADDLVADVLQLEEIDDLALDGRAVRQLLARGLAIVEPAREDA